MNTSGSRDEQFVQVGKSADGRVGIITLNRPKVGNAVHMRMWRQLPLAVKELEKDSKVIVLNANGKHFCTGIDLAVLKHISKLDGNSVQDAFEFMSMVKVMQDSITSLEECSIPIIAAIHGCCYGAGVDLITAADLRYSTASATFCVKEVDVGITADLGTLQRLPKIVGAGIASELCLTARTVQGSEAKGFHLVNGTFGSPSELMEGVLKIAHQLASKDIYALKGTKHVLLNARENTMKDSLDYVRTWNAATLKKDNLMAILSATARRRTKL